MNVDVQNSVGTIAALSLSGFASRLVPTPPDMGAVFTVTAIGSGAIGYWISRAKWFDTASPKGRVIIGVIVILSIVVLAYGYMTYFHLPTPSWIQDISGFLAFGAMFAIVCFVLGLLQIDIFKPGSNSNSPQSEA